MEALTQLDFAAIPPGYAMIIPRVDLVVPGTEETGEVSFAPDLDRWSQSIDRVRRQGLVLPGLVFSLGDDESPFVRQEKPGDGLSIFPLKSWLTAQDLALGRVEFGEVPGESSIAAAVGEKVLRVHTVPRREVRVYSLTKSAERYARAVRERGYRGLWIRLILPEDTTQDLPLGIVLPEASPSDLLADNYALVDKTASLVQGDGFSLGIPRPLPPWNNGLLGFSGALLAVLWALCLLLVIVGFSPVVAGLLAALAGLGSLVIYGTNPIFARQGIAFVAANLFPALALWRGLTADREKSPVPAVRRTLAVFGQVVALAVCGGLVVTIALGDYRFMIKTHQFLGVKVALLLPLLWAGILALFWDEEAKRLHRPSAAFLKRRLAGVNTLTRWQVMAVGILGLAALGLYLARSGNFVVPVPEVEVWMRTQLERWLVARPRTKEFLIGYPLLLVGLYWTQARINPPWGQAVTVVGSVAAVSMVNTFCHIHSPITLGLLRTLYGIILGTLLGLILILLSFLVAGKHLGIHRGTGREVDLG